MVRVPNTGAKERERLGQIRRFERLLKELDRVPAHRREDECADVRSDICRRMLAELGAPGYTPPAAPEPARIEAVDITRLLEGSWRK